MRRLLSALFLCFFALSSFGQTAGAGTDRKRIRLGEEIKLKLESEIPSGKQLRWPEINDTLGGVFEVLGRKKPDTTQVDSNGTLHIEQQYLITSFDSGSYNLPAFPFEFIAGGDTDLILANPIEISVLTVPVDTTKAIKDIRGIADVPFDIGEYIPWILGGVILLALITGLIYWYLRRKKPAQVAEPQKKTIPWKEALLELDRIEKEAVWRAGRVKQYYSAISDTVRKYYEEQLKIPALESTSDEILNMMRNRGIDSSALDASKRLFQTSDLVKFAKTIPDEPMHAEALTLSRQIVELTKPKETPSAEGAKGKEEAGE